MELRENDKKVICLGGPWPPHYLNFSTMLTDALHQLGFGVLCCADGDPRALKADVVLLYSTGYQRFEKFRKLFTQNRHNRPRVLLWQLEPLPMPGLSPEAIACGRKITKVDYHSFSPFWYQVTKFLIPFRRVLRDICWRRRVSDFLETLDEKQRQAYADVSPRDISFTLTGGDQIVRQYHPDWCDCYIGSTPPRVDFLRSRNIRAYYAPMGYHTEWGSPLDRQRDIDVVFLGGITDLRKKQLSVIQSELAKNNISIFMANKYYGKERTELLNRCKIILDLDRIGWELPIMRLLSAMSCGTLVVTSWTGSPVPFSKQHLVQCPAEAFAEKVMYYLNHPAERQEITERALDFTLNELTLKEILARMLIGNVDWNGESIKELTEPPCGRKVCV